MKRFVESLLEALGDDGPVFAYNAGFEKNCLEQLASMLPQHAGDLHELADRLVDLLELTRANYYHSAMRGSWSLKCVLPTIAPELSYDSVGEVRDGSDAQAAYLEAIDTGASASRKAELRDALLRYCERDTIALARLVAFLETAFQPGQVS